MKTKLLILCLLISVSIPAQNLIGYTAKQVREYFPNTTVYAQLQPEGTFMMWLNVRDSEHTNYYFIGKESKTCYMYGVVVPRSEYYFAKDHFDSSPQFRYQGLDKDGDPYWTEIVDNTTVYWTLMETHSSETNINHTCVMCTLTHNY